MLLAFIIVVVKNVLFLRWVAFRRLLCMIAARWCDSGDLRVSHSSAEGDFKLFVQLRVLQEDIVVGRIALVLGFLLWRQA